MKDQSELAKLSIGDTQKITIELPIRIVKRVEKYANQNGDTINGVVIEALDMFLRNQNAY